MLENMQTYISKEIASNYDNNFIQLCSALSDFGLVENRTINILEIGKIDFINEGNSSVICEINDKHRLSISSLAIKILDEISTVSIGLYSEVIEALINVSNYGLDELGKFEDENYFDGVNSIKLILDTSELNESDLEKSIKNLVCIKDYLEVEEIIKKVKESKVNDIRKIYFYDSYKETGLSYKISDAEILEKQLKIFDDHISQMKVDHDSELDDFYMPNVDEVITFCDAYYALKEEIKVKYLNK